MKKPIFTVEKAVVNQPNNNSRRSFLKMGSLAVVGSSLLLYSCNSDDDFNPGNQGDVFDLGSGDIGVLNYALALEQLEAAFYQNVLDGSYFASASANEKRIMEDLYNHEVIHREFLKTAIQANSSAAQVLPELEFNFSDVNFGSRDSVLRTAQILEDTGVAAYNGAGKLLANTDFLLVAGKIVSVEARHASAIRDLINPGSNDFAGNDVLIDIAGSGIAYDRALDPSDIIAAVTETGFIVTPFTANNLPTS